MKDHDERNDDTPIEDAEVSTRCVRVCLAHGLRTIGDVRDYGPLNMLRIQGFGYTLYRELSRMLESVPASARREPVAKASDMTIRDWFAGQALAALLADHEREWFPDFDDVVEDPDGRWMLNPDTKFVYPIPVSYTPSKSHVRVRSINTWRERLAREAYRIADAMLAARKQVRG